MGLDSDKFLEKWSEKGPILGSPDETEAVQTRAFEETSVVKGEVQN